MTTKVQDICTGMLGKIGILRTGESPTAAESADALAVLNDMLGSWSNESLLLYATVTETFSISPAASYSIGTGQTLNTERPMWIKTATVSVGGLDYEVTVVSEERFQTEIVQKNIAAYIPQYLTYNNGFPVGTIKMWPQVGQASSLTLQSEKQITQFTNLTDTFSMPPGWSHALKTNGGCQLYSAYNLPPDQLLVLEAAAAKGALKKQTLKAHPIVYKEDLSPKISIYTGWP